MLYQQNSKLITSLKLQHCQVISAWSVMITIPFREVTVTSSLCVSTDSKQHQEWCRNSSKLQFFSVPKLGKKETPWRTLLTWRLFHHLYYASAGGRGKKGRDGPKPTQILLQNLLKEMSPTTSAWTHISTEYQAFLNHGRTAVPLMSHRDLEMRHNVFILLNFALFPGGSR